MQEAQATTLPLVRGRIDTIIDRLTVLYNHSRYPEFSHYKHKLEAIREQLLSVELPLPSVLSEQVETVLTSLDAELPKIEQRVRGDYRFGPYSEFRDDWRRYRAELHEYIVFIVRGRLHELRLRSNTLPARTAPQSTMPTLEKPFYPTRSQSHPPPDSSRRHRPSTSVGGHYDPHSTSRAPMPGPSMYPPPPAQPYHSAPPAQREPQPYQPYSAPPAPRASQQYQSHSAPPTQRSAQPYQVHSVPLPPRSSQPPNRHAVPPVIPPPEYFSASSSRHHQHDPHPVAYARAPQPPLQQAQYFPRSRTPYPAAPVPTYLAQSRHGR